MTWTAADLANLDAAIATGAMKVKYADKEITYRALTDMRAVRRDIAAALGGRGRVRRTVAVVSRGFRGTSDDGGRYEYRRR